MGRATRSPQSGNRKYKSHYRAAAAGAGLVAGVLATIAIAIPYTPDPPRTTRGIKCIAIDGDTLRCGKSRIRLTCIDAPETGQPLYKESKAALAQLIRRPIKITALRRDRYGRTLAWSEANAEMVRMGLAWGWCREEDDLRHKLVIAAAETEARVARRGIWSGQHEPPWKYRQRLRQSRITR